MSLISIITSNGMEEVVHENIKTNELPIRKRIHLQVLWWNDIIKTERKTVLNIGNELKWEILYFLFAFGLRCKIYHKLQLDVTVFLEVKSNARSRGTLWVCCLLRWCSETVGKCCRRRLKKKDKKLNLQVDKWLFPAEEEAWQRAPKVSRDLTLLTFWEANSRWRSSYEMCRCCHCLIRWKMLLLLFLSLLIFLLTWSHLIFFCYETPCRSFLRIASLKWKFTASLGVFITVESSNV